MVTPSPITDDSDQAKYWREVYPQYSYCGRCGYPWPVVINHPTNYSVMESDDGIAVKGCFPLCEGCWKKLETFDARMPYYIALWDWWAENGKAITADEKIDLYQAVKASCSREEN